MRLRTSPLRTRKPLRRKARTNSLGRRRVISHRLPGKGAHGDRAASGRAQPPNCRTLPPSLERSASVHHPAHARAAPRAGAPMGHPSLPNGFQSRTADSVPAAAEQPPRPSRCDQTVLSRSTSPPTQKFPCRGAPQTATPQLAIRQIQPADVAMPNVMTWRIRERRLVSCFACGVRLRDARMCTSGLILGFVRSACGGLARRAYRQPSRAHCRAPLNRARGAR